MNQDGKYKTVICNVWLYKGACPFGDNCNFAHGIEEWMKSVEGQQNARPIPKKMVCAVSSTIGAFNNRAEKATISSGGKGQTSGTELEELVKRLLKTELEKMTKKNEANSSGPPVKTNKSKKSPAAAAGTNRNGQKQHVVKAFSSTENVTAFSSTDEEY